MEEIRTCIVCGKTYTAIRPNAKYCGKICAKESFNVMARERDRKARERRKKRPKVNSIAEIAVKARAAGMTYGQYVSKMRV